MPDHSIVKVSYRGELANETLLPDPVPPMTPNRLGDTFLIQRHLWVWTTRIGLNRSRLDGHFFHNGQPCPLG